MRGVFLILFSSALAHSSPLSLPNEKLTIVSAFAEVVLADLQANVTIDADHSKVRANRFEIFTALSNREVSELTAYPLVVVQRQASHPLGLHEVDSGYFDHARTLAFLQGLHTSHPQNTRLENLSQLLALPNTVEGQAVYALKVGLDNLADTTKRKILLIGQHHAREVMTHHAVMDSAAWLLEKISTRDEHVIAALQNSEVWFVPVVNPDGLNYVFSDDDFWRKNRAHNPDRSRGVDLNRNYEFLWKRCGQFSPQPSSDLYAGPSPQSEVETQVMDRFNQRYKFQYVISFHSHGNEVLYAYRCAPLDDLGYYDLRDRLVGELGFGQRVGSASGEDFEQHYHHHGSLAFLLEIGDTFQPPFSEYRESVWPTVQKVVPFLLAEVQKPFLELHVIDERGAPVAEAQVTVDGVDFQAGEIRETAANGTFRLRAEPGAYLVQVRKPGHQALATRVSVSSAPGLQQLVLSTQN